MPKSNDKKQQVQPFEDIIAQLLDQDISWGLIDKKSAHPKQGDMFIDITNKEFLVCFVEDIWVTIAEGSGSVLKVEFSDAQLGGSDIVTLNFGAGFDGTESPDTQINITLDHSELAFPTWSDTGITGAELEDLSDGGETTIHTHPGDEHLRSHDHSNASDDSSIAPVSVNISTFLRLSGETLITVASSPQNDFDPNGVGATMAGVLIDPSTVDVTISGMVKAGDGHVVFITNRTGTNNIILEDEGAGSGATNRFTFSGSNNITLRGDEGVWLRYDLNTGRWKCIGQHTPSSVGQGLIGTYADAGADAIWGWDDTASAYENLTQAEVLAIIGDAAADDTTKGIATFEGDDFDSSSGKIDLATSVVRAVATDSGGVSPAVHSFKIAGGEGIDTSGSGSQATVTLEDSSATNKGGVELATAAEATAGTAAGSEAPLAITPDVLAAQIQSGSWLYGTDAGGDDAYTVLFTPTIGALTTGMVVCFEPSFANVGAATLQLEAIAAKPIKKHHDQDLATGDIEIGQIVIVQYDGTNFQMQSQVANAPAGGHDSLTAADAGHTLAAQALSSAAASTSLSAHVELATTAETSTGTSDTKVVTPNGLADSNFGKTIIGILVSDPGGDAITTGDGKAVVRIPATLNNADLKTVAASLTTVSSSGIPTIQLRRNRWASATTRTDADMLSTKLTIDASEYDSNDAAAAAVINATNEDVSEDDQIFIDIDVAGTGAKGLYIEMVFALA